MKKTFLIFVLVLIGLAVFVPTSPAQTVTWDNTRLNSAVALCGQAALTATVNVAASNLNDVCWFRSAAGVWKATTNDLSTLATISAKLAASTTAQASTNVAAGTAPTAAAAGDFWNDSTKLAFAVSPIASDPLYVSTALQVLPAQTAITTVSTIQVMNSTTITIPAGAINAVGKTVRICGQFVFSNGATAPLLTLSLKFGSVVLAAPVSAANANSNSSSPALFCFNATTAATGASGTIEAHGYLQENVASAVAGAAMATYPDTVTAVSSAVDLTAAITVTLNLTVSSGPVTTATLRQATIEIIN
jgi:hypothetical protein